jgi:putative ATPase
MDDLFQPPESAVAEMSVPDARAPLATRMRPRTLDEYAGQSHLLAPGSLLRRLIESDRLTAALFYGPPGTGKTSLAMLIARRSNDHFVGLNAVEATLAELRTVFTEAEKRWRGRRQRTLLLVDEIHRFNKGQQDAMLPHVEKGTVRLIGATTHNPFFSVNPALLSRMPVFELKSLSIEEIVSLLQRALSDEELGLGKHAATATPEALTHLAKVCEGDARQALNALEVAVLTTPPGPTGAISIDLAAAEASIQKKAVVYDHDDDGHYDTISAFIKAIRGSEPDAAVYWLAKMLYAGEDIRFIARRLVISASEDIGMADPQALILAVAAQHAVEFLGMPEARIPLSEATVYLATAPKSNASYMAVDKATADIESGRVRPVPAAVQDGHYKGASKLGRGQGYQYAHDYEGGVAPELTVPDLPKYYVPTGRGYEKTVAERLERWAALRAQGGSGGKGPA